MTFHTDNNLQIKKNQEEKSLYVYQMLIQKGNLKSKPKKSARKKAYFWVQPDSGSCSTIVQIFLQMLIL